MAYILSKDATVYYEEYGAGDPLILLPGLLGTIESHWRRFIPEFAALYHTIAVDLRGHGRTNNPSGRLQLQQLIDDLAALYEALQIEQAYICGYSLGGYLGLAFGMQHPDTVRALLMQGTKFYWTADAVTNAAGSFDAEKIMKTVPAWGAQLQRDHAPANGEEGWKELLGTSAGFIRSLEAEGLTDQSLPLATFPVLVSIGDRDEMVSLAEAERLSAALPNGKLNVFEDTPHPIQGLRKTPFLEAAVTLFRDMSTP